MITYDPGSRCPTRRKQCGEPIKSEEPHGGPRGTSVCWIKGERPGPVMEVMSSVGRCQSLGVISNSKRTLKATFPRVASGITTEPLVVIILHGLTLHWRKGLPTGWNLKGCQRPVTQWSSPKGFSNDNQYDEDSRQCKLLYQQISLQSITAITNTSWTSVCFAW
jgi:hypothetical protein